MYLPKLEPLPESHLRAASDVATHGPYIGSGLYESVDGGGGAHDVVYLYLPVPEHAVM